MRITGIRARRAVRMLAPAIECRGYLREAGAGGEEPHPEIEILGPAPLVPAARGLEDAAANEACPMCEWAVDEQLAADLFVLEKRVVPRGPAPHPGPGLGAGEEPHARAQHVDVGMRVHERELAFEPPA